MVKSAEILQNDFMVPRNSKVRNLELLWTLMEEFINPEHELVQLSERIKWSQLCSSIEDCYKADGRPGLSIRLMLGLQLLKYMYKLSDEEVCARWCENPYFQYFCGEIYFRHELPIDRSSMTVFRQRIGAENLEKALQESLSVAYEVGALDPKAVDKVIVDTTVQSKAVVFPTDGKLLYRAIEHLGEVAAEQNIVLRQSYIRVAKRRHHESLRYRHAKQHNRAKRCEKKLKTWCGRIIRDIERKMPKEASGKLYDVLHKAKRILAQTHAIRDVVPSKERIYSWHMPEVECISKGKVDKPYEFGCKVSVATNLVASAGGHFILHISALHGNPYDGHTLKGAIEGIKNICQKEPKRIYVDLGYKGHNYDEGKHKVFKSHQKRGVTAQIKRELRSRSLIEPIIGHLKEDSMLGRNRLKGRVGDRVNAILTPCAFNFRQILAFIRRLCRFFIALFLSSHNTNPLNDTGHYEHQPKLFLPILAA